MGVPRHEESNFRETRLPSLSIFHYLCSKETVVEHMDSVGRDTDIDYVQLKGYL